MPEDIAEDVIEVWNDITHPNTIIKNHKNEEYHRCCNTLSCFFDFSALHVKIKEEIVKGNKDIIIAVLNSIKGIYITLNTRYRMSLDEIARRIEYIEKGIIIDGVCIKQPLLLTFKALCPEPYYIDWKKSCNNYYLILCWGIPPPSKKNCCFL